MKFIGDITANDIAAEWADNKRPRKDRARRQAQFSTRIRGIFIFLLVMTVLVFAYNYNAQIQNMAFTGVQKALNRVTTDKKLRERAINYEKQVDSINK